MQAVQVIFGNIFPCLYINGSPILEYPYERIGFPKPTSSRLRTRLFGHFNDFRYYFIKTILFLFLLPYLRGRKVVIRL